MAEEGNLPPWDDGQAKATAPMEYRAPTEILLVERYNMKNNDAPQFPSLFSFTTITSFALDNFLLQYVPF